MYVVVLQIKIVLFKAIYICYRSRLSLNKLKQALSLVDSWSRAPDQIQMYQDRDTIPRLLSSQFFVCLFCCDC